MWVLNDNLFYRHDSFDWKCYLTILTKALKYFSGMNNTSTDTHKLFGCD